MIDPRRPRGYRDDLTPVYTWEEVEELLCDTKARRVAYDVFASPEGLVAVSTVHLVIDHAMPSTWSGSSSWCSVYTEDHVPLLYESMVFGGTYDGECWRYPTRDVAQEGHVMLVAALTDGRDPTGALYADRDANG